LKYSGAGMHTAAGEKEPILEFSTYYVSARRASKEKFSNSIIGLFQQTKPFAEFVSQYNPTIRRLTIFKVFLNGVLPPGRRAGARTIAEQLLCIPIMGWDGIATLRKLQEVHLCDIVNWNTYVLLSMVGKGSESDVDEWLLCQELSCSGLTKYELQRGTVEAIFAKTALGKLVRGMLAIWKDEGVVELVIQSVRVRMNASKHELIQGEHRSVMDVFVSLRCVSPIILSI